MDATGVSTDPHPALGKVTVSSSRISSRATFFRYAGRIQPPSSVALTASLIGKHQVNIGI